MSDDQNPPGPLAGLRILELADETGQFCGKLLGDLGADVVKIEPPGGEPNRHVGPFLDDIPHPERSLSFWYYNRPNAASPSVWKLPTAGRFSGVWRRHRTSFWKPFGRASRRRWGSITNHCANKTPG